MQHLPTVEASIRYWEAVRLEAAQQDDPGRERTATSLKLSYEATRRELLKGARAADRGSTGAN
jgi:hypothetical protein